ncbi:MAG TPA: tetratricopeptide repeat protein [Bacteroidales bacterium]|nr:tetratricopeptide repeat protein [Bacteroidales bacterium]
MSLFIDVIDSLSNRVKQSFISVIDSEKKDQERTIRKICDFCRSYLDYGELRYDRMENGITEIEEINHPTPLLIMLLAVMNESLDEDDVALKQLRQFSGTSTASDFRHELEDFTIIGETITLKKYENLEQAAGLIIDKYTDETTITDTLSNLYLKIDDEKYNGLFLKLLEKAKEKYTATIALESLTGFISIKGQDYQRALASFLAIKDKIEADRENAYYNYNMASTLDNIAACYLKLGDTARTIEACDAALDFEIHAGEVKVGSPVLYKKAEALIMAGDKEKALAIAHQILAEFPEDEMALELAKKSRE